MSIRRYTVADTAPISINPAGMNPGSYTVRNDGSVTVYLSDTAITGQGWPVAAGNSMMWKAETPLYAYVEQTGTETSVLVMDTGTVSPLENVGATLSGPITIDGYSEVVENVVGASGAGSITTTDDVSRFSTLVLRASTVSTSIFAPTVATVTLVWYTGHPDFDLTAVEVGRDSFQVYQTGFSAANFASAWAEKTVAVRSAFVRISMQAGNASCTMSLIVAGSQSPVISPYYSARGADATAGWANTDSYSGFNGLAMPAIAVGSQVTWRPGVYGGRAIFSITTTAPTNAGSGFVLSMTTNAPGMSARIWGDTVFESLAVITKRYEVIIPDAPVAINLNNQTAVPQNPLIAITFERI